ncbi:MAG: sarcosine oxidase subunit gamma [Chloroflexi bacterium]|nr:MAG: sarcosine oxidase subunit gamma [Chloroflexota bacterium]
MAEAVRRSPFAGYAERFAALSEATGGELTIRVLPFATQLNLRMDPKNLSLVQRISEVLGFGLPVTPNTVGAKGDRRALWLGPDEWLAVGPDGQQDELTQALTSAFNGALGSVTDVSANRTLLEIRGAKARELLAHGLAIDLDPRLFGPGRCAQTLLAKAQVIVERRDESGFVIYVRASFAAYVATWLLDALAE